MLEFTHTIDAYLQEVIPKLINRFQTGFVLARFIAENTLVLQAVVQYARHRRRNDIALDQADAYDGVYPSCLHQTLLKLGFPTALVRSFVDLLFTGRHYINISGHLIQMFNQGRVLLQGDFVSPSLFSLALGHLLHHILQGESFLDFSLFRYYCVSFANFFKGFGICRQRVYLPILSY
jgi:hypothetical protein